MNAPLVRNIQLDRQRGAVTEASKHPTRVANRQCASERQLLQGLLPVIEVPACLNLCRAVGFENRLRSDSVQLNLTAGRQRGQRIESIRAVVEVYGFAELLTRIVAQSIGSNEVYRSGEFVQPP